MIESILTVTSAANVFDLTTVADVKSDLGITGSTYDTILARYVTESSVDLASACNRVFARETLSELFRLAADRPSLQLRRWPVSSITSVTVDGTGLASTDYEVDAESGLLWRLNGDCRIDWPGGKVVVVYVAGYDLAGSVSTNAPKDLQKAARAIVKAQYLSRGRDPLVKSESVPGVYDVAYWVGGLPGGEAWPADIKAVLNRYTQQLF